MISSPGQSTIGRYYVRGQPGTVRRRRVCKEFSVRCERIRQNHVWIDENPLEDDFRRSRNRIPGVVVGVVNARHLSGFHIADQRVAVVTSLQNNRLGEHGLGFEHFDAPDLKSLESQVTVDHSTGDDGEPVGQPFWKTGFEVHPDQFDLDRRIVLAGTAIASVNTDGNHRFGTRRMDRMNEQVLIDRLVDIAYGIVDYRKRVIERGGQIVSRLDGGPRHLDVPDEFWMLANPVEKQGRRRHFVDAQKPVLIALLVTALNCPANRLELAEFDPSTNEKRACVAFRDGVAIACRALLVVSFRLIPNVVPVVGSTSDDGAEDETGTKPAL